MRAEPGYVLVIADYSQIELRIAARIANDANMIEAFQQGQDLHELTARRVLGISEVTKEQRQLAKALNFGLLYGMGPDGLRRYARANYGVRLSETEARDFRDKFFDAYPGLAKWHRQVRRQHDSKVRTLLGRRRLLGSDTPDTVRLNTPVQGIGADGLKLALAYLWQRREQVPAARLILACHDEIVLEVPEHLGEQAANCLRSAMLDAMAAILDPVPVEVETRLAPNW